MAFWSGTWATTTRRAASCFRRCKYLHRLSPISAAPRCKIRRKYLPRPGLALARLFRLALRVQKVPLQHRRRLEPWRPRVLRWRGLRCSGARSWLLASVGCERRMPGSRCRRARTACARTSPLSSRTCTGVRRRDSVRVRDQEERAPAGGGALTRDAWRSRGGAHAARHRADREELRLPQAPGARPGARRGLAPRGPAARGSTLQVLAASQHWHEKAGQLIEPPRFFASAWRGAY